MAIYALISWFSSSALGLGYILTSLLVTCLMLVYDTQVIVEQSERGYRDVPQHAMVLFIDLFKLFVRIVKVLVEL
jgi:FtsH-binding integral membrane protein